MLKYRGRNTPTMYFRRMMFLFQWGMFSGVGVNFQEYFFRVEIQREWEIFQAMEGILWTGETKMAFTTGSGYAGSLKKVSLIIGLTWPHQTNQIWGDFPNHFFVLDFKFIIWLIWFGFWMFLGCGPPPSNSVQVKVLISSQPYRRGRTRPDRRRGGRPGAPAQGSGRSTGRSFYGVQGSWNYTPEI